MSNFNRSLEVTRFHSFIDEVDLPFTEDISAEFFEPESSIQWYIAIRSAEMFRTKNARYPGQSKRKIDEDVSEMTEYAYEVIAKLDADDSFDFNDDYLLEIARFSNSTLHNIGAFLGGVASQEIVKLLTHQYTPMNHTFIFDGTHWKSQVFNP